MKIRPLGKSLLVNVPKKEKKEGGIILTTQVEEFSEGLVLSIGDDVKMRIKPNDKVLVHPHAGRTIPQDDKEVVQKLISEDSVLAVIEE